KARGFDSELRGRDCSRQNKVRRRRDQGGNQAKDHRESWSWPRQYRCRSSQGRRNTDLEYARCTLDQRCRANSRTDLVVVEEDSISRPGDKGGSLDQERIDG